MARKENRTFRSLTEQGLRLVLKQKSGGKWKWKPVVVENGGQMTEGFRGASWDQIRDEITGARGVIAIDTNLLVFALFPAAIVGWGWQSLGGR